MNFQNHCRTTIYEPVMGKPQRLPYTLRCFISLGIVSKAYASGLKYEVDISMFRTCFLFFLWPLHPLLASFYVIKGQVYLYTQPTPKRIEIECFRWLQKIGESLAVFLSIKQSKLQWHKGVLNHIYRTMSYFLGGKIEILIGIQTWAYITQLTKVVSIV